MSHGWIDAKRAHDIRVWWGLVTFYTVFVIDLASRRVQIVGSTPVVSQYSAEVID